MAACIIKSLRAAAASDHVMTHHRIPLSTLALYTADDIADAERDLASLMAERDAEDDPHWRAVLADWIEDDTSWLAEMIDGVALPLVLVLPIGQPAPGPCGEGRA